MKNKHFKHYTTRNLNGKPISVCTIWIALTMGIKELQEKLAPERVMNPGRM